MQWVDIFPFKVKFQLRFLHFYYCEPFFSPFFFFSIPFIATNSWIFLSSWKNILQMLSGLSLPNKYLSYIFMYFLLYLHGHISIFSSSYSADTCVLKIRHHKGHLYLAECLQLRINVCYPTTWRSQAHTWYRWYALCGESYACRYAYVFEMPAVFWNWWLLHQNIMISTYMSPSSACNTGPLTQIWSHSQPLKSFKTIFVFLKNFRSFSSNFLWSDMCFIPRSPHTCSVPLPLRILAESRDNIATCFPLELYLRHSPKVPIIFLNCSRL